MSDIQPNPNIDKFNAENLPKNKPVTFSDIAKELVASDKDKKMSGYTRKWETVNKYASRLPVPNGWLVWCENDEGAGALCFVLDSNYTWILEDKHE